MTERLRLLIVRYRFPLVVAGHVMLFALSYYVAFVLRLESFGLKRQEFELQNFVPVFLRTLPWLLAIRLICFARFDLFRGLWRYVSVSDLAAIFVASTIGTVVFIPAVLISHGRAGYPISVFVIEWLMVIFLTGGARFAIRVFREVLAPAWSATGTRICIVGAGDAGEMLIREMRTHRHRGYWPVVLVDDDDAKVRRRLHGLTVAGTIDEIPQVCSSYGVGEIVIAIPTASGSQMERIVKRCEESGVRFRIQPADGDSISLARLREVEITDLLGRPPAHLDVEKIQADISGRRVLITGAAGSIGAELVRQCAGYAPARLTLLDRNENGLFYLEREMLDRFPDLTPEVIVGDLLDPGTLERAFPEEAPDYVFHAAAFKHVPLMEANPEEAVKNNVLGTRKVAEASRDAGVSKFVLISTDKAVRPTSVMGATKRAAELLCQAIDPGGTIFTAVRFGNVLGSQGSIVPLFQRQIRAGGPVTVTHPDAVRFFMTIPEAVQLVLQAGTMGEGGEVFLLDMGKPVRIVDLAENLIRLSGLIPGEDVSIEFIGLRPGEKLFEELLVEGEGIQPTGHDQIRVLKGHGPRDGLLEDVDALVDHARACDRAAVARGLLEIVPEYKPNNEALEKALGDQEDAS